VFAVLKLYDPYVSAIKMSFSQWGTIQICIPLPFFTFYVYVLQSAVMSVLNSTHVVKYHRCVVDVAVAVLDWHSFLTKTRQLA